MKKVAVMAFTEQGSRIAEKLVGFFGESSWHKAESENGLNENPWEGFIKGRFAGDYTGPLTVVSGSLSEWTKEKFSTCEALIFIGAAGIAVRSIAPYLCGKDQDPAVLVIDEQGCYVISLLSGHLGGANELALKVADKIGAKPVITTATDREGRFSPDCFAKDYQLELSDLKSAKALAAAVLRGERLFFYSELPWKDELPKELTEVGHRMNQTCGIHVTPKRQPLSENVLTLYPRVLYVGMGCKKHSSYEDLNEFLNDMLLQTGFSEKSIKEIASIDIKKEEQGLVKLCKLRGLPFVTWSADQLRDVAHTEEFSASGFVKSITGVDNVCERAAICSALSAGANPDTLHLVLPKTSRSGMTIAFAMAEDGIFGKQKKSLT